MSERSITSPIPIIHLVSDEETKDLLLKKIAKTKKNSCSKEEICRIGKREKKDYTERS